MASIIEFDLYIENPAGPKAWPRQVKGGEKVICFSDRRFTPDAVEIKPGEPMPEQWHPDYDWLNLNIMAEMVRNKKDRTAKTRMELRGFIGAFIGVTDQQPIFMHVWRSRLPNPAPFFNPDRQ